MKQLIFILIISNSIFGQNDGAKYSKSFNSVNTDFSKEFIENYNSKESLSNCNKVWERMNQQKISIDELTDEDKEKLKLCDEYGGNPWSIPFKGCSWYCVGIVNKINSSSICQELNVENILVDNIHDFDYGTAWISNVNDKSNFIEYVFDKESAEFTEVIIVTGNIKNSTLWNEYSRAKTIKMFINNVYFATLQLDDVKGEQIFKFEPIGIKTKKKFNLKKGINEWKVKFEIVDSYRGLKPNIAISEIIYEGNVH